MSLQKSIYDCMEGNLDEQARRDLSDLLSVNGEYLSAMAKKGVERTIPVYKSSGYLIGFKRLFLIAELIFFWGGWASLSLVLASSRDSEYEMRPFFLWPLLAFGISGAGFVWTTTAAAHNDWKLNGTLIEAFVGGLFATISSLIFFEVCILLFTPDSYGSLVFQIDSLMLTGFFGSLFGLLNGFGLKKLIRTFGVSMVSAHFVVTLIFCSFIAYHKMNSIGTPEHATEFAAGLILGVLIKATILTAMNFGRLLNRNVRSVPSIFIWRSLGIGGLISALLVAAGAVLDATVTGIALMGIVPLFISLSYGLSLGHRSLRSRLVHTVFGMFIDPFIGVRTWYRS